jgi:pentafunctional AROM polypeptide
MPPRRSSRSSKRPSEDKAPEDKSPEPKKAKPEPAEAAAPKRQDGVREVPVVGGSIVYVGNHLLERIPEELTAAGGPVKASRFVIVSDTTVFGLYGKVLVAAFEKVGHTPLVHQVTPGENSKARRVKEEIEDWMLANKCLRDTCLVALGGGVVGDLTGYVAATFMRGVPVIQIPTSMMAMLDSSVGGKTAVNVPAGKNLIGAFHQPLRVYADMQVRRDRGLHGISARFT